MTEYLNPLDSAFLLLETYGTSMNIGAIIELEGDGATDPRTTFDEILTNIDARIHEIPVLTKRIVRAPFDLTWPILVEDRAFDITKHVRRVALPAPGSPDQFDALISKFLSQRLPKRRPLWELLVIEGLEDGRTALALKVHHALADGVSGAETFAGLFDISPDVRAPSPVIEVPNSDDVTSSWGLLRQAFGRSIRQPSLLLGSVPSWFRRFFLVGRGFVRVVVVRRKKNVTPDQPSLFEARRSSLNGSPSEEKSFHRLRVPLAGAKRAAKSEGASVTDFVMAATGGALRRLLVDRDDLPKRDLIAFVPINVRPHDGSTAMGNRISGMLVPLHIHTTDPVERLRSIATDSAKTVGVQRELRAEIFQDLPRIIGPALISLGAKLISAFRLFDRIPPMANLMISSVPGPPIPLWLSGNRVASAAPVGPLFGTFSLNITVLGFEEHLEFGLLGCAERLPDLEKLRDYILQESQCLMDLTASPEEGRD